MLCTVCALFGGRESGLQNPEPGIKWSGSVGGRIIQCLATAEVIHADRANQTQIRAKALRVVKEYIAVASK